MAKAIVTRLIKFKTLKSFGKVDVENIHSVKPVVGIGGLNEGQTVITLKSGSKKHTTESVEEIERAKKEALEG